jgi:predicted DNA-binding transcriptional regulator
MLLRPQTAARLARMTNSRSNGDHAANDQTGGGSVAAFMGACGRSGGSEERFDQRVALVLQRLGLFVSPFDNMEHELEVLLTICKGKTSARIFLHLFRHGPCRFRDITRELKGVASETMVAKSLKKMVENGILRKEDRLYDVGLRGLRWVREKKAKPTILLTVG